MVATECIRLTVTEEELNELRTEKTLSRTPFVSSKARTVLSVRFVLPRQSLCYHQPFSNNTVTQNQSRLRQIDESNQSITILIRSGYQISTQLNHPRILRPTSTPDFDTPDDNTNMICDRPPPDTSLSQASNDSQRTPKKPPPAPLPPSSTSSTFAYPAEIEQVSPWADVPSFSSKPASPDFEMESTTLYSATALAMR